MNTCSLDVVKDILILLQKNNSIRSVSRSTSTSKNTVKRYKLIFENILGEDVMSNIPNKDEKFRCATVGTNIDINDCLARIAQAQGYKDRGEEHFSLFKCLKCKKVEELFKEDAEDSFLCIECNTKDTHRKWCSAADWDGKEIIPEIPQTVENEKSNEDAEPVCTVCSEVKSAKKQWRKKGCMHQSCYISSNREGIDPVKSIVAVSTGKSDNIVDSVFETMQEMVEEKIREDDNLTVVDFTEYTDVCEKLMESARINFRTPELQIIYLIDKYSHLGT